METYTVLEKQIIKLMSTAEYLPEVQCCFDAQLLFDVFLLCQMCFP